MTKKDFFRLVIKLFGLYWLVNVIFSVGQFYNMLVNYHANEWSEYIVSILIFILFFLIFLWLVFKPDIILSWLKLDRGFDDDKFDFGKLSLDNITMLALIIVGLNIIVNNIIPMFHQLYLLLYKLEDSSSVIPIHRGFSGYYLILYVIKILIGYLLLTNYKSLSNFILKHTGKNLESDLK